MSTGFVSHLTEGGIQNQFDEETIVPHSQAGTSDNDSSSKTTDKEVLDGLKFLNLNREYSSNDTSIDIPKDPLLDENSSHLTLEGAEEIQQAEEPTSQTQATTTNNDRPFKIIDRGLLEELSFRSREGEYSRSDTRIMLQNVGDSEGYYSKPKELSIGPIHARNPNLFKKELKHKLAAQFLGQMRMSLPSSVELEEIAKKVVAFYEKESLRDFYDEEVTASYTDGELIELLFLDGCALLGFIDCYMHKMLNMFNISNAQAALIQNDLFSLENQIPFQLLFVLFEYSTGWEFESDFCRFITLMCTFEGDLKVFTVMKLIYKHRPVHILDLLREVIVLGDTVFSNPCGNCLEFFIDVLSSLCCCGERLLYCVAECVEKLQNPSRYQTSINHYSFRNVQELKKAGIEFKPSDSLKTISFHSKFFITVQLLLPTLVVDSSTAHKLYNLVMYEESLRHDQSRPNYKPWVTSYVHFLDLLIDTEQDVKDLRAADILRNCLESDAEVARMINSMGSNIFTPRIDTYKVVKNKLEKHYRNRSRRKCSFWIAQVRRTHFSSPWTILALFAAITVLALTAIQTYYAVNPKN